VLQPLSQTAKAFRDTTISRSSRDWFNRVARQWGIPHPSAVPEAAWRQVVRANALGPRGVYGPAFQFVFWALSPFSTSVPVSVALANPQRLTADVPGSFLQEHIGLWAMRTDTNAVWRIDSPSDITTSSGNWVTVASLGSAPYWAGTSFGGSESFTVSLLPFTITEKPGVFVVNVSAAAVVSPPATYMQPAGALVRAAAEPFGGQVQLNEIDHPGDPLGTGPHPPYLSDGGTFQEYEAALQLLLPAGIHAKFVLGGP
jgi:hypothetical protein